MPHLLEGICDQVAALKSSHRLFSTMDELQIGRILPAASDEMKELVDDLEVGRDSQATGELSDVFVYYFSYLIATKQVPSESMSSLLQGVNGYGKNSAAIERAEEVMLDSADDPRAVQETLRRWYSIGLYLPVSLVTLDQFKKTTDKVRANRPVEFYSGRDPMTGTPLRGEEAMLAFKHFEQSLRMIRDNVGRTLSRRDWQPHQAQIADWRNSAANIAILQQNLAAQK